MRLFTPVDNSYQCAGGLIWVTGYRIYKKVAEKAMALEYNTLKKGKRREDL